MYAVWSKFEPERLNGFHCFIVMRPVFNNITRCISLWCHHRSTYSECTELFLCILLSCDCKARWEISRATETKLRKLLPSPLPSIHPHHFFFFYPTWHAFFIIAATFYSHPLVYFTPILTSIVINGCHWHEFISTLIWSPGIPPTPRNLPFPLFQSTCDTLRSHSDSLGFAPNVLPSHPAIGNFEEFACWWRRGQDPSGTV